MDRLEEKLGYRFRDRGLLRTALTHSSFANEKHSDQTQSSTATSRSCPRAA